MTTITIRTEGQPAVTITLSGTQNLPALSVQGEALRLAAPALTQTVSPSPSAPVKPSSGWWRQVKDYSPGLMLGLFAAVIIMNTRQPASVPVMPPQALLPALPGAPVYNPSAHEDTGGESGNVQQLLQRAQRDMFAPPAPVGQVQPDQGGAPTAPTAPVLPVAPVAGATAPSSASSFGLEP